MSFISPARITVDKAGEQTRGGHVTSTKTRRPRRCSFRCWSRLFIPGYSATYGRAPACFMSAGQARQRDRRDLPSPGTGGTATISMKAGSGEGWHYGASLPDRRWFTLVNPVDFAINLRLAGSVRVSCTFSGRKNWFVAEADRRPTGPANPQRPMRRDHSWERSA